VAWVAGAVAIFALRGRKGTRSLDDIDLRTAALIGFCQCLAMWPGTSRSLATILGGVVFGVALGLASGVVFGVVSGVALGVFAWCVLAVLKPQLICSLAAARMCGTRGRSGGLRSQKSKTRAGRIAESR